MILSLLTLAICFAADTQPVEPEPEYVHPSWTQVEYIDPLSTAAWASGVGFGAGHFSIVNQLDEHNAPHLSRRYETAGNIFLGLETATASVAGISAGMLIDCGACAKRDVDIYTGVAVGSLVALGITRLVERVTVNHARHRANKDLVKYLER